MSNYSFRDSLGYLITDANSLKPRCEQRLMGYIDRSLESGSQAKHSYNQLLTSYPQRSFERRPFSSITPTPYNYYKSTTATPNPYDSSKGGANNSRYSGYERTAHQAPQQNQDLNRSKTPAPSLSSQTGSDFVTRFTYSPAMNVLCLTTISEVNPHLYLSGASAINEYKLRAKGITFVVNVTVDFPNVRASGVECMAIRLDDSPSSQLLPYFDTVADKIREVASAPGKTLVHCMVGASRSATLVIAYLMKHRKMTLLQAYHYLKRIRPVIRPNPGFFRQLVTYEYKLFDEPGRENCVETFFGQVIGLKIQTIMTAEIDSVYNLYPMQKN